MSALTLPLPDFRHPPVVEVALSVQFSRLEDLRAAHFGLLWTKFRPHGFTSTQDHGLIEPAVERFDQRPGQPQVGVQVRAYDTPPLPRVWFVNEAGTELIQIQPDRFIRNWRKVNENDEYVRFKHIRERFIQELQEFGQFIKEEQLGDLAPTQCEVTYVNHIVSGDGWESHAELAKVLSLWSGQGSDPFLSAPEGIGLQSIM